MPSAHQRRLRASLLALRVERWPYPGAAGLVERDGGLTQVHVVRNWRYLGSTNTPEDARRWANQTAGFDTDGYRILVRPMMSGALEFVPLEA